jgi:hypothetical protein
MATVWGGILLRGVDGSILLYHAHPPGCGEIKEAGWNASTPYTDYHYGTLLSGEAAEP